MDGSLSLHVCGIFADELLLRFGKQDTLVCGGRDFNDVRWLRAMLEALAPTRVIEGGQTGADTHAREWAIGNYVPHQRFDADWKKYGPAAGPLRNGDMLAVGKPAIVVAFPGGIGTRNMVMQARAASIPVLVIGR